MLETDKLELGGAYCSTVETSAMIFRSDQFKQKRLEMILTGDRILQSVVLLPAGVVVMVVALEVFEHYGPNICVQLLTGNGLYWQEFADKEEFFCSWIPLSKALKDV